MEIMSFIPKELLILVVVNYVLGVMLKNIKVIKDEYITIIITIFSIIATILKNGVSIDSVFIGILASGTAVLGNQTLKQIQKKDKEEGDE